MGPKTLLQQKTESSYAFCVLGELEGNSTSSKRADPNLQWWAHRSRRGRARPARLGEADPRRSAAGGARRARGEERPERRGVARRIRGGVEWRRRAAAGGVDEGESAGGPPPGASSGEPPPRASLGSRRRLDPGGHRRARLDLAGRGSRARRRGLCSAGREGEARHLAGKEAGGRRRMQGGVGFGACCSGPLLERSSYGYVTLLLCVT